MEIVVIEFFKRYSNKIEETKIAALFHDTETDLGKKTRIQNIHNIKDKNGVVKYE